MVEEIETDDVNARLARIRDGMKDISARMDGLYDEIRKLNSVLYWQEKFGEMDESLLEETAGLLFGTSGGGECRFPVSLNVAVWRLAQSYWTSRYSRVFSEHGFVVQSNRKPSEGVIEAVKKYRCHGMDVKITVRILLPEQMRKNVSCQGSYSVSGLRMGRFDSRSVECDDPERLCKGLEAEASRVACKWPVEKERKEKK